MTDIHSFAVPVDHVLRLYARLADVSRVILDAAHVGDWEAVANAQAELVEVSTLMTHVEDAVGELDEFQKTSRILYLTAALEDQRQATECLAQQSLQMKQEAGTLRASERLRQYENAQDR